MPLPKFSAFASVVNVSVPRFGFSNPRSSMADLRLFTNGSHARGVKTFAMIAMAGALAISGWVWNRFESAKPSAVEIIEEVVFTPVSQLKGKDIALVNLLCGDELPGSDFLEKRNAFAELDRMARQAKAETERHYRKFQTHPEEYNDSEAYFRMLCLVTVLQQDFGVGYSPNRARPSDRVIEPNETFFADSRDIFLHGLLQGKRTGTCASLPVLYIAVGRRLGYPLKLVAAKNHLFVRWEDTRERLNIEATTQGLTTFNDDYYRRWPFPMTPEEERTERYLISLSPAEELSVFLSLRTQCLLAAQRWNEALSSQEKVCRLAPYSFSQREILEHVRNQTNVLKRRNQNHQTALNL